TPSHNPLIIKGCRQCGKTYSALRFARENYTSVVYINFFENPLYSKIFDGSLDVDTLIMNITAVVTEADFKPHDTCLVLPHLPWLPHPLPQMAGPK
ncbi:MAG: AAA family ATPase, partial [Muribaculum sp.]|nr:AAA family ATPase [Muribaculum sp.]